MIILFISTFGIIGICYARTRLDEFRGGVPCRSNAVPYKERSKYSYDKRRDEKMIGTCNAKCPRKYDFSFSTPLGSGERREGGGGHIMGTLSKNRKEQCKGGEKRKRKRKLI